MSDAVNGNGGGNLPVLSVFLMLLTAALGALTTWMLKVDDRLFALTRDVPTRPEIQSLRADLTARLDRIDGNVATLLAAPRPVSRP